MRRLYGYTSMTYPYPGITATSWVSAGLGSVADGVYWGGAFTNPEEGSKRLPMRFLVVVMSKRKDGGYWLSVHKTPNEWRKIEEQLRATAG